MELHVYQSLWGMEGLPWRGCAEWPLEERFERIAAAGFDGVSLSLTEPEQARRECEMAIERGLRIQAQYFPTTIEGLRPVFTTIAEIGPQDIDHLCLQPDVRPPTVLESIPYLLEWQQMAEDAGVTMYVETHRNRMTTDLPFTLALLEAIPSLKLVADLSHFVVAREFAWPIAEENHEMIRAIMRRSWAYHGRVASREQVQLQVSFPQHRQWLDLFAGWWREGFAHFRANAEEDAVLTFTPELGPPRWYAMTGPDGEELSDRWQEACDLAELARQLWAETEHEPLLSTAR